MKKLLSFITVFALLFTACEGPQGPPGFEGPQGLPGQNGETALAFEITTNFNAPNFSHEEPYGFTVFPDEITLVYILWETLNDGSRVWRLMPQTVIFDNGDDLVYNFDFTTQEVLLFLEGSNLPALGNEWTQNQTFRIVVIPTTSFSRIDLTDINAVIDFYGITEFEKRN